MPEWNQIFLFLSGVAVGGISSSILWKFQSKKDSSKREVQSKNVDGVDKSTGTQSQSQEVNKSSGVKLEVVCNTEENTESQSESVVDTDERTEFQFKIICDACKNSQLQYEIVENINRKTKVNSKEYRTTEDENCELVFKEVQKLDENAESQAEVVCNTDLKAELQSEKSGDFIESVHLQYNDICDTDEKRRFQSEKADSTEGNTDFQSSAVCDIYEKVKFETHKMCDTGEQAKLRFEKVSVVGEKTELQTENVDDIDEKVDFPPAQTEDADLNAEFQYERTDDTDAKNRFQSLKPINAIENCALQAEKVGETGFQSNVVTKNIEFQLEIVDYSGENTSFRPEHVYATDGNTEPRSENVFKAVKYAETLPKEMRCIDISTTFQSQRVFSTNEITETLPKEVFGADENAQFQSGKLGRDTDGDELKACCTAENTNTGDADEIADPQSEEICGGGSKKEILQSNPDDKWLLSNYNSVEPKNVHVISDFTQLNDVVEKLVVEVNKVKILGFDCEWTSSNSKANPIALVQLATSDYTCYLLRTNKMSGISSKKILNVLHDKAVLKVGVGVIDDAFKLFKGHGTQVHGCVDLRAFAIRCETSEAGGLKSLAKKFVGLDLDKSDQLRCSDWDADVLTDKQVRYAAFDAFAALRIFEALIKKKMHMNPICEQNTNKSTQSILWSTVRNSVRGLVDVPFKERKSIQSIKCTDLQLNNSKVKSSKGVLKNPKGAKSMKAHSTRTEPLYDNCKMEAPNGQLLSTCDRKKALWYIHKNLAETICEEPLTIRLRFQPSGWPDSDRDYYLHEKENKCVVCGSSESFVRKNVVPHEYRRHFALPMKDHLSHDILLMCLPCHQQSNYYDCLLRMELTDEFQAPQGSIQSMRLLEDDERRLVRSAGKALLQSKNPLPVDRRVKLKKAITDFFKTSCITPEMIKAASELETRIENQTYVPHGEKVILSVYGSQGVQGVLDFAKRWREHFVRNMKPKFLPLLWSVDHNREKAKRRWNEMDEEYRKKIKAKSAASTR